MNQKYNVDFATFCHKGDAHRLHAPGQLKRQVESNNYQFNKVHIIYQLHKLYDEDNFTLESISSWDNLKIPVNLVIVNDLNQVLIDSNIDVCKPQYVSETDKAHIWKNHVVNHLAAIQHSESDYIVFADNDCWMVDQPPDESWVEEGIRILNTNPDAFIVSPNDGEPCRTTMRMSQQMFLARVEEFRNADFNQPGWDGNVNVPGGPMPEYWAMLEGRIELHCRVTGQYRYVLGPEYRYWHFNKLTEDGFFETDLSKY